MSVIAIIPAAGLGTRMSPASASQAKPSKQFFEIGGVPILIRTLRHFADCTEVDRIIVALRPAEIGPFRERLVQESYEQRVALAEGGENRQESVYNALKMVEAQPDDVVLVHDAVRPFVEA